MKVREGGKDRPSRPEDPKRLSLPSLLADWIARTRLNHRTRAIASGTVVAMFAATAPCSAQVRLEVTPFAGAYLPRTVLASAMPTGAGLCNPDACLISEAVHEEAAPIAGTRVTAWLQKRFAVEIAVGYSPSAIAFQSYWLDAPCGGFSPCTGTADKDEGAWLLTGSARVLVALSPSTPGHASIYLVGGWGFMDRGGRGYDDAAQGWRSTVHSNDGGPTIGVGVRTQLTPTLATRFELQGVSSVHGAADFVLSAGLSAAFLSAQ